MKKLTHALSETLYIAAIILFIAWLAGSLSGWYWFWCFIIGYFFDEISY